ncbi:hypothetical protein SAZ89_08905 [Limosilactobacillus reuteri]|nr:hypothetical protein [Limosilactobacillus reuteri]
MNKPYIIVHMMTSVDEISILIGAGVDGRTGQPSFLIIVQKAVVQSLCN